MRAILAAGDEFQGFTIIRLLGAGANGVVYLAKDDANDRLVALKLLPQDFYSRRRFQREADTLEKLRHRNIIELYSHASDQQMPYCYLVTQYIDGVTLRDVLNELFCAHGPCSTFGELLLKSIDQHSAPSNQQAYLQIDEMDQDDGSSVFEQEGPYELAVPRDAAELIRSQPYIRCCCELIADCALALDYAHEQSMLHRDVKPENLMVDRSGRVYLIDFGVVRCLDRVSITRTGALIGTTRYTSPEQLDPAYRDDNRSDIYSLGIVLYELLTLRHPIGGNTPGEILHEIEQTAILPVWWLNESVSQNLRRVVHKACAKDLAKRYATALEFALDLRASLNDRPVSAPRYRYKLDLGPIVSKRPLRMTLAGLVLSTSVIFTLLAEFAAIRQAAPGDLNQKIADAVTWVILGGATVLLSVTTYAVFYGHKFIWWLVPVVVCGAVGFNVLMMSHGQSDGRRVLQVFVITFTATTLLAYTPAARAWFAAAHSIRRKHGDRVPRSR